MTTAVDLSSLEAKSSLQVLLARSVYVRGGGSGVGDAFSGFSDAAGVEVTVDVAAVRGGGALVVTVEGSADGESWSPVAGPFSFTRNGSEVASVDSPPDQLRVSWSVSGSLQEAVIGSVSVAPDVINKPNGGGGSQPAAVTLVFPTGVGPSFAFPAGATVPGYAITSPNGVMFQGEVTVSETVLVFFAAGTVDGDGNFTDGPVMVTYNEGQATWYAVSDGGSGSGINVLFQEGIETHAGKFGEGGNAVDCVFGSYPIVGIMPTGGLQVSGPTVLDPSTATTADICNVLNALGLSAPS